jgi:hypothetical protein
LQKKNGQMVLFVANADMTIIAKEKNLSQEDAQSVKP